jgi:hypothetical protein
MSVLTHELTRPNLIYRFESSFQPLARIVFDPSVLAVRADSPFETVDDLIRASRAPEAKITWGGTFLWGAHHVHFELFRRSTGAKLAYIPFDGAAESRAALLGGHLDVGSGGFSEYAPLAKEGRLRILASGATERWRDFPDVATYKELGYDIQVGSDRGFAVPSGTAPERIQFLIEAIREALASPSFLAAAEKMSILPSLAPLYGSDYSTYLSRLQSEIRPLIESRRRSSGWKAVLTGSKVFPVSLIAAVILFGSFSLAQGFSRRQWRSLESGTTDWEVRLKLGALVVAIVIFYIVLPIAGFIVSGLLFIAVGMALLAGRRALPYLPVAALIPIVLVLLFQYGLEIRLPMGVWN